MNIRTLALLAMLLLGPCAAGAATQSPSSPRVSIEQVRHVFPTVVEGTQVSHAFSVRNVGDAPLVIKNVRTG